MPSPRPEAPRPVSPKKELPPTPVPKPAEQAAAAPAMGTSPPRTVSPQRMSVNKELPPRTVSPQRLSINKELPPTPVPRPGSPQKRNSVSPSKGGERAQDGPAPPELKEVIAKLDEKVRGAARYLVDEQSSLWVQNLDNVRPLNQFTHSPIGFMREQYVGHSLHLVCSPSISPLTHRRRSRRRYAR